MTKKNTGITKRVPDCVTEVRRGNTVLTVSGFFKQDSKETAEDKMARVFRSDNSRLLRLTEQTSLPQAYPNHSDNAIQ